MSKWIPVSERLPPEDTPVWMFIPDIEQPVLGCLSDAGEGMDWGRCYDEYWWDKNNQVWKADCCDVDGDVPSHWKSLPMPPCEDDDSLISPAEIEKTGGEVLKSISGKRLTVLLDWDKEFKVAMCKELLVSGFGNTIEEALTSLTTSIESTLQALKGNQSGEKNV
jgi:hypothetical protein